MFGLHSGQGTGFWVGGECGIRRGERVGWLGMGVVGLGDEVPNVGRAVGKGKRMACSVGGEREAYGGALIITMQRVAHAVRRKLSRVPVQDPVSSAPLGDRCNRAVRLRREGKGGGKKGAKGGKGGGGGGGGPDKAVVAAGGGGEDAKDKELELDEFLEAFEQELEVGVVGSLASGPARIPWWERYKTIIGREDAGACMTTVHPPCGHIGPRQAVLPKALALR